MKFYDFVDKQPAIGELVIVEGTERVLADRALDLLLDRTLAPEMRDLNLERFSAVEWVDASRVRAAVQAMPFLADRRVVVVTEAQTLKADQRRDLWSVAEAVPEGSTLVIMDLLSPRSLRPKAFGSMAGRSALRVDTTAGASVRERFVRELLAELEATAEERVVVELAEGDGDLTAVRNDLEKLALMGKRITYAQLSTESLVIEDPKAYLFATAVIEGKLAKALPIAQELFASDPRGAAIPLLSALATEMGSVWELARRGSLKGRIAWREPHLRPLARRIGTRRAAAGYARAVRAIEAYVTGKAGNDPDDYQAFVERISVELSGLARAPARR